MKRRPPTVILASMLMTIVALAAFGPAMAGPLQEGATGDAPAAPSTDTDSVAEEKQGECSVLACSDLDTPWGGGAGRGLHYCQDAGVADHACPLPLRVRGYLIYHTEDASYYVDECETFFSSCQTGYAGLPCGEYTVETDVWDYAFVLVDSVTYDVATC